MTDALDARLSLAGRIALLLDYDGTLVPIAESPERALPGALLLDWLSAVASRPHIDLHLVTGRPVSVAEQWFGRVPASLWAEHAAAVRPAGGHAWETTIAVATDWLAGAERLLESVRARTPGALIERKTTSIVWHYRMVDPALAGQRLAEVTAALRVALGDAPVELMEGKMALEVRPRGVSKAIVVRQVVASSRTPLTIAAIGDDRTDEDMFAALPANGIAIHVGGGPSLAPYRLRDVDAVRRFVARVAGVEPLRQT